MKRTREETRDTLPEAGLEQVLLMAAAEPRYAEALLDRRTEALKAVSATDVVVSDNEHRILESVDDDALRGMAARVAARVDEPTRRVFLGQALLALGALGISGAGCKEQPKKNEPPEALAPAPGVKTVMRASREPEPEMEAVFNGMGGGGGGGGQGGMIIQRDHGGGVGLTGIRPGMRKGPRVRLGRVTTVGFINRTTARRVLRRHLSEIKYLYVSLVLPKDPKFEAKVELAIKVKPDGTVGETEISKGAVQAKKSLAQGIVAAAKRWRFPKAPSPGKDCGIVVRYHLEIQK